MTPLSVPWWIITVFILCKSLVISINFDSMLDENDTIEETMTTIQQKIPCTKDIASNLSCPSGKYANSKCFCATCFDFGEPCSVDSQCCKSSHMSCWKFSGLSNAYCLCDESYSWDAYAATCFMPGNLPQQMLMITLYSFIAMIVVIAFLFTISHVCNISICPTIKPRTDYIENRDLTFLQEPETRSYRDLPPSYSQIFPGYCSQDAMVNAELDLALPLYSQAVEQQNTNSEVYIDVSDQRQLVTNHSFQMHFNELPPTYEESSHAQMIRTNTPSISTISGNLNNNSHLTETWYNIRQVPKIIITPSDTEEETLEEASYRTIEDEPELITPPAALLQVPERLETETIITEPLNRPLELLEPEIMTPSNVYSPVFVSTMNIILQSTLSEDEVSTSEGSMSNYNNPFISQSCENGVSYIENSEVIQHSHNLEQQQEVLLSDFNQNLQLNNVSETNDISTYTYTINENYNNNSELNQSHQNKMENIEEKIAEIISTESQLPNSIIEMDFTPVEIHNISRIDQIGIDINKEEAVIINNNKLTSNNYYGESSHITDEDLDEREDISSLNTNNFDEACCSLKTETTNNNNDDADDTYESNRVFKFDYAKFCNFERSQAASIAFEPSVKSNCSSYTSPACQM